MNTNGRAKYRVENLIPSVEIVVPLDYLRSNTDPLDRLDFQPAETTILNAPRKTFRPVQEELESRNLMSAMTFVVTSDGNAGTGSLRQAITLSNQHETTPASPNIIIFAIAGGGLQKIVLTAELPAITSPALIDGYTEPGSSENTNPITSEHNNNAVLTVQLSTTQAFNRFFQVQKSASGSTIRGLSILNLMNHGLTIPTGVELIDTNDVSVTGNFIGSPAGRISGLKFAVAISDGRNNTVGGSAQFPELQNVMGQYAIGVYVVRQSHNDGIIDNIIGQPNPRPFHTFGVDLAPGSRDNHVEFDYLFGNGTAIIDRSPYNVIKNNTIAG